MGWSRVLTVVSLLALVAWGTLPSRASASAPDDHRWWVRPASPADADGVRRTPPHDAVEIPGAGTDAGAERSAAVRRFWVHADAFRPRLDGPLVHTSIEDTVAADLGGRPPASGRIVNEFRVEPRVTWASALRECLWAVAAPGTGASACVAGHRTAAGDVGWLAWTADDDDAPIDLDVRLDVEGPADEVVLRCGATTARFPGGDPYRDAGVVARANAGWDAFLSAAVPSGDARPGRSRVTIDARVPWAHVVQTLAVLHAAGRPRVKIADLGPSFRLEVHWRTVPTAAGTLAAWFTSGAGRFWPEVLAAAVFSLVVIAACARGARRQASSTAQP
ncbi:MAG: hypothetical protein U1E39_05825 [Planctomycetota bacterium]